MILLIPTLWLFKELMSDVLATGQSFKPRTYVSAELPLFLLVQAQRHVGRNMLTK